jgi:hypothetical protein
MTHDQKTINTGKGLRMRAAPSETVTYNFSHELKDCEPLPLPMGNKHLNVAYVFSGLLGAAEDS